MSSAGPTQPARLPCTWQSSPRRVTLLVRGESLAAGMSDYLITQMEATPNVVVRLRTRVVDGRGETRLEALTLEDPQRATRAGTDAAAVFILIGAEPRTDWLRTALALDDHGFILTGRDLPPNMAAATGTASLRDQPARCTRRWRRTLRSVKRVAGSRRRRLGSRRLRPPVPGRAGPLRCGDRAEHPSAIVCNWAARCARAIREYRKAPMAGVQFRCRFRNLRGSAAGLSHG